MKKAPAHRTYDMPGDECVLCAPAVPPRLLFPIGPSIFPEENCKTNVKKPLSESQLAGAVSFFDCRLAPSLLANCLKNYLYPVHRLFNLYCKYAIKAGRCQQRIPKILFFAIQRQIVYNNEGKSITLFEVGESNRTQ